MKKLLLLFVFALTGCGQLLGKQTVFQDHGYDYLQGKTVPPVQVPPNMVAPTFKDDYPIPGTKQISTHVQPASLLPPTKINYAVSKVKVKQKNSSKIQLVSKSKTVEKVIHLKTVTQSTTPVATLNKSKRGVRFLTIQADENHAWRQVGRAAIKAGYPVISKNRRAHVFHILDIASTHGVITHTTPVYQVHMASRQNVTKVWLSKDDDNATVVARSGKVLKRMLKHIA